MGFHLMMGIKERGSDVSEERREGEKQRRDEELVDSKAHLLLFPPLSSSVHRCPNAEEDSSFYGAEVEPS